MPSRVGVIVWGVRAAARGSISAILRKEYSSEASSQRVFFLSRASTVASADLPLVIFPKHHLGQKYKISSHQ